MSLFEDNNPSALKDLLAELRKTRLWDEIQRVTGASETSDLESPMVES